MSVAVAHSPVLVVVLTETDEADEGTTVYAAPFIDVVEPWVERVSCGPPEGDIIVTAPAPPELVVVLTGVEVAEDDEYVETIVRGWPSVFQVVVVVAVGARATVYVEPWTTVVVAAVPDPKVRVGTPAMDTRVTGWPSWFQVVVVLAEAAEAVATV